MPTLSCLFTLTFVLVAFTIGRTSGSLSFSLSSSLVVASVLLVTLVWYLYHTFTFWTRQGIANEPKSFYNRLLEPLHRADMNSVLAYGNVVGLYEGFRPSLLVADQKIIAEILQNKFWSFANHRMFYQPGQLGSKKLVVLEGQEWKGMRAIISPLFTAKNVKMMKSGIDNSVQRLLHNLQRTVQTPCTTNPVLVDVRQLCAAFALEVVAETVFGVRVDSLRTPDDPIVKNLRKLFGVNVGLRALVYVYLPWLARLLNLYLLDYHVLVFLHDFTKNLLRARIAERNKAESLASGEHTNTLETPNTHLLSEHNVSKENSETTNALPVRRRRLTPRVQENFITWLLDAEYQDSNGQIRKLTEEEIIDNSMLFIVAGVDTTSSTLSIIMHCLACFPQVQHKLYLELLSFRSELHEHEDDNGAKSFCFDTDTLNRMEYLSACIWEAMRYIPAVPRIDRRSTEDCYLQVDGRPVFIPKDTIVTIPTYALYRNPKLFEQPDQYWPERFMSQKPEVPSPTDDTCNQMPKRRVSPKSLELLNSQPPTHRGVFMPFALGIRDCIGKLFAMLELKTVIAHVVLNYELRYAPQTKKNLEFFKGQPVLNAKDIRMYFVRRPSLDTK